MIARTIRSELSETNNLIVSGATFPSVGADGTVLTVGTGGVLTFAAPVLPLVTASFAFSDYGSANRNYVAGFYESEAVSTVLTIDGTVAKTFGAANSATAAHAFCVAGGASAQPLVLTVSGTSITDNGVLTVSDTEVLVADCSAVAANQCFETSKKWLGTITYTLTGVSGSFEFNLGFCTYEDNNNTQFTIKGFEFVSKSSSAVSDIDVLLYYHNQTGWTFSSTVFVPGGNVVCSMATDYAGNQSCANEGYFSYQRSNLDQLVDGTGLEGFVIAINIASNNAVRYGTAKVLLQPLF